MKRLLLSLCLLLIPFYVWAGVPIYYIEVSATDANTTVTIDIDATSDKAFSITLVNDGSNEIFFNLNSSVATSSDPKLKSGESLTLNNLDAFSIKTLGIICSTGETATVRVFAYPMK